MIVYGGFGPGGVKHGDTWALSLDSAPTWTQLATSGSVPPSRAEHVVVYDPELDRMIVVGGNSFAQHDTWALSLGSQEWTQIATTGDQPTPRAAHA
jgi:hypothetical protein